MQTRYSYALLALSLGLAGCGQSAAPASQAPTQKPASTGAPTSAAASASAAPTALSLVYDNLSIGSAPVWLMDEKGIFQKYGLTAKTEFAEGTVGAQALLAGQYDVGFISTSAVVATNAQQPVEKMVAVIFPKLIYSLVAAKPYASIEQLRGRTFGIAKLGDSSDTATRLIVRKLGLDPDKDIKILQIGNSPARYAALLSGNVDAILADPMDVVRARRDGLNILATPAQLNIEYASGTFALRDAFLKDHRDVARRFVMAVVDGIHYYKTHQDEVAAITGQHLKSDDTQGLQAGVQTFADQIMPKDPLFDQAALQPIVDDAALRNPSLKGAPFDRFVDNSLVQELEQSGFIDQLYR